jgi:hypothetical protein
MSDQTTTSPMMAAAAREWLAARIVFVAGFVIALAFVGWWAWDHRVIADDLSAIAAGDDSQLQGEVGSGQTTNAGIMLCGLSIATAQNFGIFPANMRFAGGPEKTSTAGRYVCAADDPKDVRFLVSVDLVCRDLRKPECANIYSVTKTDGTSIYQRHQFPGDPGVTAEDVAPPEPDATAPPSDGAAPDGAAPDAGTQPDAGTPPNAGDTPH